VCPRLCQRVPGRRSWLLSLALVLVGAGAGATQNDRARYPTEEDAIRMVRIAGRWANFSYAGTLTEDFAYFSPDRKQIAVVLKRGNLERNTNEYSLLLFKTSDVFASPKPRVLASMSSSSNREGITDVEWLTDNDTLLFRGENPGEASGIYAVSSKTGTVHKLTNHPTNVIAFSSDARGQTIVYAAERPAARIRTERVQREQVTVSNQDMSELLIGMRVDNNRDLFVLNTTTGTTHPLPIAPELKGRLYGDVLHFSLSPDGKQLAVSLNLTEVPASWHEYQEHVLARVVSRILPKDSLSYVFRYAVIDIVTGEARILFEGPVSYHGSEIVWRWDARSLVLTGVFLPIEVARQDSKRLSVPAPVEIDVKSLQYTKLANEDLRFVEQENDGSSMTFETRHGPNSRTYPESRYFRHEGTRWLPAGPPAKEKPLLAVAAEQDLNTPPKIVATDSTSGQKAVLLDPNPQLREIEFGKVEAITFTGAMHQEVRAGLYFPAGFVSGKRYPLVVQTHGFEPSSFWIDGSFTTAFAAQALAGRGFLVLQVPDVHAWDETTDEAPNMAETLERAVEYVDALGCLDRDRLGIIGFSRTGLYAYYLLTHSKLHFGAAVIADGSDGGYSQYLQFLNAHQYTASDSEAINGAAPFGSGLLYWLRRSPEFSLDMIDTPLMLQVNTPDNLPSMWAPFVGLKRLGKPVELLYFPTGTHMMEKPWDRLASQGGAVDWFSFWLMGEEAQGPEKAEKFKRWRDLRNLQAGGTRPEQSGQAPRP
jgi:dipeptidyl aminopeptidase/acylaminoacyl peptidase